MFGRVGANRGVTLICGMEASREGFQDGLDDGLFVGSHDDLLVFANVMWRI